MVHVGIGYDVHQLVAGRKLVLGGVEIPHTKGLDGHSDADALMHAICDAVLGALGEEDIGLAIVKHIVQAHGGEVRVESVLGQGATFFFTLPAADSSGHSN